MNQSKQVTDRVSAVLNRRNFLRQALTTGAGAALLPTALSLSAAAQTEGLSAATEQDYYVLSFALHLEYLEANYYNLALKGQTLSELGIGTSGFGTEGNVVKKASSTIVPFLTTNDENKQIGTEITADETHHVEYIRAAMKAAGLTPPAQPKIDLLNSWNTVAKAAGIADSFDPFASEIDYAIGGATFEDVGVTAYNGSSTLLTSKAFLQAAASILPVEAYHSGVLRLKIFEGGKTSQEIYAKVSALRAKVGGGKDQGVTNSNGSVNLAPTNADGLAFARTARQVMNIVFGAVGVDKGLFFPDGMNLPSL